MRPALILATLLISTAPAMAVQCSFDDYDANIFEQGSCSMSEPQIGGAYEQVFTLKGRRITIDWPDHQGQFHRWKINGKPAAAYEFNRERYCGWTDDLKQAFCYALRGRVGP
ncbi:hypothetical protein [Methylobacterium sp. D48H]